MTRTQVLRLSVHCLPFELICSLQSPECMRTHACTHVCTHTHTFRQTCTHAQLSILTAAQLITPQLTVHGPITAHSIGGAALHRLLVLDPRVAPPEIDWKTTKQTAGSLPTPGRQDTEQPEALGVLRHRPEIPLGLWGSLPPSVWRERLLRNALECSGKLLQAGQHQADSSSHPEREKEREGQ